MGSFRLERASTVIESNHQPSSATMAMCPQVPHPWFFSISRDMNTVLGSCAGAGQPFP